MHDMKRGKAPGWDIINAEHGLFGVEVLCLPSHLKKVLPVPKGHGNSRLKDNTRGITVLLLSYIKNMLVKRWEGWANQNGVIDE